MHARCELALFAVAHRSISAGLQRPGFVGAGLIPVTSSLFLKRADRRGAA
jgi:hypothetical protein